MIKVKCPNGYKLETVELQEKIAKCPDSCILKEQGRCNCTQFRFNSMLSKRATVDFILKEAGETLDSIVVNDEPAHVVEEPRVDTNPTPTPAPTVKPSFNNDNSGDVSLDTDDYFGLSDDTPFDFNAENNIEPEERPEADNDNKADKYNSFINTNSIFNGVEIPTDDRLPIFKDGVSRFYLRNKNQTYYTGDAKAAMKHILIHWQTNRVFNKAADAYRNEFLVLLKILSFTNEEDKLKRILELNKDVNFKLFKLFYGIIYRFEDMQFFYSESPSLRPLTARYFNKADFVEKILKNKEYFSASSSSVDELLIWLGYESLEKFIESFPKLVFEKKGIVSYFKLGMNGYRIIVLGRVRDVINGMRSFTSLDYMKALCEFLSIYKIDINGNMVVRSDKFIIDEKEYKDDDSIYKLLDFDGYSANYASCYKYYTALIKEYIDSFKPERIKLGRLIINKLNFYDEVKKLAEGAYMCYDEASKEAHRESISMFLLLRSLTKRGIIDYYYQCETDEINTLRRELVEVDDMSIEAYMNCNLVDHIILENNKPMTIDSYISEILNDDIGLILKKLDCDLVNTYFRAKLSSSDMKAIKLDVKKMLAEHKKELKELKL